MKYSKQIIFTLIALLMSGCATQTFLVNGEVSKPKTLASHQAMDLFFVYGIGQTQLNEPQQYCRSGTKVHSVEMQYSFLDWAIGFLSNGIVGPRTYRVYCQKS